MKKINFTIRYLYEFYYRIIHIIIGIIYVFSISYSYKQTIVYTLLPIGITHFIATDITEIFLNYIQLCSMLTIFITTITIVIQVYLFLKPGLYLYESNNYLVFITLGILTYFLIYTKVYPGLIQLTWEFFLYYTNNFNSLQINFEPKFTSYISYIIQLSLIIIILYPLVIISFFITQINLLILAQYRSIVYLIIFLMATIITPPDPFSQLLLGLLLCLLYEIRIFIRMVRDSYKIIS